MIYHETFHPPGSGCPGDTVADEAAFKRFVAAYDAKHQLTMEGDNKAINRAFLLEPR